MEAKLLIPISKKALPYGVIDAIEKTETKFGYGLLSQIVLLRSYLRRVGDRQETWKELVTRVMEGSWSIFMNHMERHQLPVAPMWEKQFVQMARLFTSMKFLPGGRGLWMMGTPFVYEKGAIALNNCAAVTTKNLVDSAGWAMDMLMHGCGVGFDTIWKPSWVGKRVGSGTVWEPLPDSDISWTGKRVHVIPDSREGWVWSMKILLNAYLRELPEMSDEFTLHPEFDYGQIRQRGAPIRGFGGIASGPEPLMKLHKRLLCYLRHFTSDQFDFYRAITEIDFPNDVERSLALIKEADEKYVRKYDSIRLVADIFNAIGDCVVSGNVRRSSEIAIGPPESDTFRNLKNVAMYPERRAIAHNSNNSVKFTSSDQYSEYLPSIVEQIRHNGEPGLLFQINITEQGRLSHVPSHDSREYEKDKATLSNPCGEICLESKELCNLSEVMIDKFIDKDAFDMEEFLNACTAAALYCKIVSILPTTSTETNAVIARNRRIGVSLSGIASVYDRLGSARLIAILKKGYRAIRDFDKNISEVLGVVQSIRVTTCKPSGTTSLLTGSTPGVHFAIAGRYVRRRVIVSDSLPLCEQLKKAGVEHEPSLYSPMSTCFSFYIDNGPVRCQSEVSLHEMLGLVTLVQREWADNMVSSTISFNQETEGDLLERAISMNAPLLKSCAFLPEDCSAYPQLPFEAVKKEDCKFIEANIVGGEYDPEAPKYCENGMCELRR